MIVNECLAFKKEVSFLDADSWNDRRHLKEKKEKNYLLFH